MDGRSFGEAYVDLDRIALHRLRESGQLATRLAAVERVLNAAVAADLKALCDAGCDREEILWLLRGAYAGPAFSTIESLLGRKGRALTSARQSITNCANLIANINQRPFGGLVSANAEQTSLSCPRCRIRAARGASGSRNQPSDAAQRLIKGPVA